METVTIKRFKRDNLYVGKAKGQRHWYVIHQDGQRTWYATLFTHADVESNVIKGNANMAEEFDYVLGFDKKDNQSTRRMREYMFKILKWGDPEYEEPEEEEAEETPSNDIPRPDNGDESPEETEGVNEDFSQGGDESAQPLPLPINEELIKRRYSFILSNDGQSWFIRNNENGKYLNPIGVEVDGGVKFGRDKNRAYKLITRLLEKEQK